MSTHRAMSSKGFLPKTSVGWIITILLVPLALWGVVQTLSLGIWFITR